MMKPHCDNCDALTIANTGGPLRVTVNPGGFNCDVTVTIAKGTTQLLLCPRCLDEAMREFQVAVRSGR